MINARNGVETQFCQHIINSISEAVKTIDQNRKILVWNKAAEVIRGYDKAEVQESILLRFTRLDFKKLLFTVESPHNFGFEYHATLMSWFKNFNNKWNKLKDLYVERFYRMWKYYLLNSAGAFQCRGLQVWQFVLSPKGVQGGYDRIC